MGRIRGGCLCGKLRYEANVDEPLTTVACHCTHCQRQSGGAYSVNIGIPGDSLTVTGDTLRTYEDTGASGQPVLRNFCGSCGSPIFSDVTAGDGLRFVKVGTLDDSSWIELAAEIWCDSKVGWGKLGASLPKIPTNPPLG